MVFERVKPDGTFVAWGKDKAKENSLVVDAGGVLEGKIENIKLSDTYGYIFEIKTTKPKCDKPVIVPGTTILLRAMGYTKDEEDKWIATDDHVIIGDKVQITFLGMLKTKFGDAYNFEVLVDR